MQEILNNRYQRSHPAMVQLHQLIGEIAPLHLVEGRRMALGAIAALNVAQEVADLMSHEIGRQNSTQELIDCLKSFADFLGGKEESDNHSNFLTRLAVRRVGEDNERFTLISVDEILYIFSGAALSRRLLDTTWSRQLFLRRDRIYVRTAKGLFVTQLRSLTEISRRLDPARFLAIHQSIVVNLQKLSEIDLRGRVQQVGVTTASGVIESLRVSRRSLRELRERLGLPARN